MPQVTEAVFYCNYLVDGFVIFSQAERGGWRWGEGGGEEEGGEVGREGKRSDGGGGTERLAELD